jgi:hypothetical protein
MPRPSSLTPLALLLLAGCSGSPDPKLCLGSTCVAVATSVFNPGDFNGMGTLNSVDLATRATTIGIDATLDPDVTMKIEGEELFVLLRDTGSLRVYDPKTFAVKVELKLGAADPPDPTTPTDPDHPLASKALPQNFWVQDDHHIFVTLSGNDAAHALGIVDRTAPNTIAYVGLPQDTADVDGKPEPNELHSCNGKLYVTLQSYFFDEKGVHYATGRVAILDPDSRTARGVITLAGNNPYDLTPLGSDCNDVVVATSSNLTTVPDGTGNLERLDLDAAASRGILATDEALGGRPTLLAPAADNLLYVAIYDDPQPNAMGDVFLSSVQVLAFDPQAKAVRATVTPKFGNVNFLRTHGEQLFLGAGVFAGMEDPSKAQRGLYISPADGTMVTSPPIDLKLTPSAIALPD